MNFPITKKEKAIAKMMAEGKSGKEIGELMDVKFHTKNNHQESKEESSTGNSRIIKIFPFL